MKKRGVKPLTALTPRFKLIENEKPISSVRGEM